MATSLPITTPQNKTAMVRVDPTMMGMESTQQNSDDSTPNAPAQGTCESRLAAMGVTKQIADALKECRRRNLDANAPKRQEYLDRFNRALETFKNNPYVLYDQAAPNNAGDTLNEIMSSIGSDGKDADLYSSNDNIYQMLGLTFVAALSVDLAKTRFQPTDADNEEDIFIASKASTIRAYNERQNNSKGLQRKELLWLWIGGCYFAYTRNIVDANRAKTTKQPIKALVNKQIAPDRYVCPQCGDATPSNEIKSLIPRCQNADCQSPMTQADFFEGKSGMVPTKIGDIEVPNAMTAEDIFSGANVDCDCDADELYDSAYLDLSIETNIGPIRKSYPDAYRQIQGGTTTGASGAADQASMLRAQMTSPAGVTAGASIIRGTYSRCWLQPEAFNVLDDQTMADTLTGLFPDGVKMVLWSDDLLLDAVPEKMTDRWTACRTIKGFGMYPFGVGDSALDVQKRINDVANSIHAYIDRLAYGTILVDGDYLDADQLESKPMTPGNMTSVYRRESDGGREQLQNMLWQPEFHIDPKIFEYHPQLVQLAQQLAGVQPQVFGGSDPNVQTKGGQAQALKTAMGRMAIFLDQMREEHADRAVNSVRCTVDNMDALMKITEQSDIDGDTQTVTLLRSQLTGNFDYAESDEGFPSSYEEVQERIMTLLTSAEKNPWLMNVLADPDTQNVVARYVLPDQIKMAGEDERARLKLLMNDLAKTGPQMRPGPTGQPMLMPSILPDEDIEDYGMAVTIAKGWMQRNWQTANTPGYLNVRAFLKLCKFQTQVAAAKQAMLQQNQQGGQPQGQQQQAA
jgi:hypothetical protein